MRKAQQIIGSACLALLVSGCGNSNESNEPTEALRADDGTADLAQSLITGSNSQDANTRWVCTISNDSESADNYVLSFWSDKTGVAGTESMSWFEVDASSVAVSWGTNQITLSNFLFEENDLDSTSFSATSNKNDRLDCQLSGPKPIQADLLQDFSPIEDTRIVNDRSNQQDNWDCIATDDNGVVTQRQYAFWIDGMGTGDSGNYTWYFNDDDNIIVSTVNDLRELRSIRYNSDETTRATAFTAFDRQHKLECTR